MIKSIFKKINIIKRTYWFILVYIRLLKQTKQNMPKILAQNYVYKWILWNGITDPFLITWFFIKTEHNIINILDQNSVHKYMSRNGLIDPLFFTWLCYYINQTYNIKHLTSKLFLKVYVMKHTYWSLLACLILSNHKPNINYSTSKIKSLIINTKRIYWSIFKILLSPYRIHFCSQINKIKKHNESFLVLSA